MTNQTTTDTRIGKRRDEIEVKAGDLLFWTTSSRWGLWLVEDILRSGTVLSRWMGSIGGTGEFMKSYPIPQNSILIATNATQADFKAEAARLSSQQGDTGNSSEIPNSSEPSRLGQVMTRENARPGDLCEGERGLSLVMEGESGWHDYFGEGAIKSAGKWVKCAGSPGKFTFSSLGEKLIAENATPADFHARLEELKAGKNATVEEKPEVKFGQCWRLCDLDFWPMSWLGDQLWGLAHHGDGVVCWEVYHCENTFESRQFEYLYDALPPSDFPGRPVMDSKMRYLPGAEEWIAEQKAKRGDVEANSIIARSPNALITDFEAEKAALDEYSQQLIDEFEKAGPGSIWAVTQYGDKEPTARTFDRISTKLKHPSAIFRDRSILCISSIAKAELGWPINPRDAKPGDILEVEFTWAKGTVRLEVFTLDRGWFVPLGPEKNNWICLDEIKSCRLVSRKEAKRPSWKQLKGRGKRNSALQDGGIQRHARRVAKAVAK